jgi:hypothetical protein
VLLVPGCCVVDCPAGVVVLPPNKFEGVDVVVGAAVAVVEAGWPEVLAALLKSEGAALDVVAAPDVGAAGNNVDPDVAVEAGGAAAEL